MSSGANLQRRTLIVLATAQVFGGVGFFLGVTVAALLARDISGSEALGGVPLAFAVAAGAIAAAPLGAWMARVGRRPGLAVGHLIAAAGAALVVLAAGLDSFSLLCLGMAGFGLGNTANLLARYAAADLAPEQRRARAISVVLLATAAGAIVGPNLASPTVPLAEALGVLPSAAPFAVAPSGSWARGRRHRRRPRRPRCAYPRGTWRGRARSLPLQYPAAEGPPGHVRSPRRQRQARPASPEAPAFAMTRPGLSPLGHCPLRSMLGSDAHGNSYVLDTPVDGSESARSPSRGDPSAEGGLLVAATIENEPDPARRRFTKGAPTLKYGRSRT